MGLGYHLGRRDWLAGAGLGAAAGTLILGVGGRLAMRGIALLAGQSPGFSFGGTGTVIVLGTFWGLVGGLALVGLRFLLPTHRFLRAGLLWAFLLLITLRGLRPIDAQRLLLFVPLVIAYGATLQLLWCRVYRPRRPSASLVATLLGEREGRAP